MISIKINFKKWTESIFGQAFTPEEEPSSVEAVKKNNGAFPSYDMEKLPYEKSMKRNTMKQTKKQTKN